MDELRETFHVERTLATVWERLRLPTETASGHCRIPGFPDLDGKPGGLAAIAASEPQRLLRGRKKNPPCAGTEIDIEIGPANASGWPARVTVAQSGFPAAMAAMGDMTVAHWRQIVADFRLYLEQDVVAPATVWGASLGAAPQQTPIGLVLAAVDKGGFADRSGMRDGDLLLTLRGIRIHDIGQLWTVLALSNPGDDAAVSWVRDRQRRISSAPL